MAIGRVGGILPSRRRIPGSVFRKQYRAFVATVHTPRQRLAGAVRQTTRAARPRQCNRAIHWTGDRSACACRSLRDRRSPDERSSRRRPYPETGPCQGWDRRAPSCAPGVPVYRGVNLAKAPPPLRVSVGRGWESRLAGDCTALRGSAAQCRSVQPADREWYQDRAGDAVSPIARLA